MTAAQYTLVKSVTRKLVGGAHVYLVVWNGRAVGVATRNPARDHNTVTVWDVDWDALEDSPSGTVGLSWVRGTLRDLKGGLARWSEERTQREEVTA